jgi:hypothetical protein
MKQQPRVETVEDFKLRIAAIIRAQPDEIPSPPRSHALLVRNKKRASNRKAKRRTTEGVAGLQARPSHEALLRDQWMRAPVRFVVLVGEGVGNQLDVAPIRVGRADPFLGSPGASAHAK